MNTSFLHTQENTSSRERAGAIHYDSHYNVDLTCTPTPRFKSPEYFHCFTFFSLFHLVSLWTLDLSLSPSLSVLLSSQPSGHRVSFKVLILIWNLLQSVQHWTWNTGLWDLIRVYKHACLCSDGFLLHFQSKIINETPGRVAVKDVRWCIIQISVFLFIGFPTLPFYVCN